MPVGEVAALMDTDGRGNKKEVQVMNMRYGVALALVTALVVLGPGAYAQQDDHSQHHAQPEKAEGSETKAEGVSPKCQMMAKEIEGIHAEMKAMSERLDAKVAEMNKMFGQAKVGALVDVVTEIVAQQKRKDELNASMMQKMLAHMGEHMAAQGPQAKMQMDMCPMMKQMHEGHGAEHKTD